MAFLPAKCCFCGKDIQIPDDQEKAICMYCGNTLVVRDVVQITTGPNINNLLALANTARISKNYIEAHNYYNKVLEIDFNNSTAWYGKGETAGWMSTVGNFLFPEMLVAFDNAIKFSEGNTQSELRISIAKSILNIGSVIQRAVFEHFRTFAKLPGSLDEYLSRSVQIFSFIEYAHYYLPYEVEVIKDIIYLCEFNIEIMAKDHRLESQFTRINHEMMFNGKILFYKAKL